jgi:lambda family phage tail tape measure protein
MANTIARLGVRLGIDSAEFSKGIEAAKKDLSEFASQAKTFATVGATAFAAMTYKALEFADSISDVAKANDMAITTVLKLGEALDQNGGSAENAGKILNAFTAFVDKAATGSFEAQKAFKDVGISLKDIGSLSMEELFAKTLKGLSEIPDQLTRQARAYEILGRAMKGAEVAGVAEDMEKTSHVSKEQAKSIEDAAKAWDMLHKITHEVLITFTAFVGTPALKFTQWLESSLHEIDKLSDAFTNLGRNMKMLADFSSAFGFAMFGANTEKLKKFNDEYARFKRIQELGSFDTGSGDGWDATKADSSPKRLTKEGRNAEAEKLKALELARNRIINKDLQDQDKLRMETLKKEVDAYHTVALRQMAEEKSLKDQQAIFELAQKGLHMRAEDAQLAKDLYEIESNRAEKAKAISRDTILDRESKVELLKTEESIALAATNYAYARNLAMKSLHEGTFAQGFNIAMSDYFRNAATEVQRGQQAFEAVMGNMNAALDNFVRNGKLSFKDLARSIIQDLIAIELKASAMSMFKSMGLGSLFGKVGGMNMVGSTHQYGIDVSGMYADGGDPAVGQVSLVGERGPELFVPKTAGTIIPNNMLGSMGSNQPSVTYNGPYIANMSAIDTQSATQFLAKNKSAVWAANQTAQRSLPQSR